MDTYIIDYGKALDLRFADMTILNCRRGAPLQQRG